MLSYTTLAEQGHKAFNSSNYAEAINYYTQALDLRPDAPDYYLKRSIAYQRSSKFELALHDAELATMFFDKRGKREAIGSAQLRRGIAFFFLCRYGDAGLCFQAADARFGDSHKDRNMLGMWRRKLEIVLEKLDDDDIAREVTIVEIPNVEVPKAAKVITELEPEVESTPSSSSDCTVPTTVPTTSTIPLKPAPPPPLPVGVVTTPASKIRHEWYQTPSHVVLTLFVKGVPKDKALIQIDNQSVSISFPLPSGSDFVFDISPLFDSIVASESTFNIFSTKIEVKLVKSTSGKKWADLEGTSKTETNTTTVTPATSTVTANPTKSENKPVYPSSSRTGPKDWDKLANELSQKPKKKKKGKGKNNDGENDNGDGDDDDGQSDSECEDGDPVNHFFKKFYKDADEDTRRAMIKSYVESNGTALSTNWSEVGRSKVETSPPDGMTAKNWDG